MTRLARRAATALATATFASTLAACGTDAATAPDVAPSLSRGAPEAPFVADVAALTLRPGGTRTIAVTHRVTGEPVLAPTVRWSTTDAAVATVDAAGLVIAVAPGSATITVARGVTAVDVHVTVVDPCAVGALPLGTTTGEITADDCPMDAAGRRADYYALTPANGEVVVLATSGLAGVTGVKATTADPTQGLVFGAVSNGATYRVIGNGDPLQFYVSNRDDATLGAYAVTRGTASEPFACGELVFVVPGASFASAMAPATACQFTIRFSPYPEVIGKPIATERFWVRLEAGRPYTVALGGVGASFDPALTIFPNLANAGPVAQSAAPLAPGQTTRSVTFTPAAAGYYLIEVSSGRFVAADTWSVQWGTYTMSVSR